MSSSVTDQLPAEQHKLSRKARYHPHSLPTLEVPHARPS